MYLSPIMLWQTTFGILLFTLVDCQKNGGYNIHNLSECPIQVEPIGCYEDNKARENRALPDQIITGRDRSSGKYVDPGIVWGNYNRWLSHMICECAKKVLRKKNVEEDYIGIQYYGECWANLNGKAYFDKFGASSRCITGDYNPYVAKAEQRCQVNSGQHFSNFVYKVNMYHRTCPEINGTYTSPSHGILILRWDTKDDAQLKGVWKNKQFTGELLRGCHGKMMYNDGRQYSIHYNTKKCQLKIGSEIVMNKKDCVPVGECPYFVSHGCYKDLDSRKDPNFELYAFNERDSTNENWSGQFIKWNEWGTGYLADLLCRCAQKAIAKKKRFFSIQYLGECWITDNEAKIKRHGKSTNCLDRKWKGCQENDKVCKPKLCAGKQQTNKVYEIKQGPLACLSNPCSIGEKCVADGPSKHKCL